MKIYSLQQRIVVRPRPSFIEIVPGGACQFKLFMEDDDGLPVDLSAYSAGRLALNNCKGVRSLVDIEFPLDKSGVIPVSITSAVSTNADNAWRSGDLELTKGGSVEVYPLNDFFVLVPRNSPPSP